MTVQAQIFLEKVTAWAENRPEIIGLALVGSYARDEARPDSDVDLVLLVSRPQDFIEGPEWIDAFGAVKSYSVEDWGLVTSLRVYYESGLEVEYGFSTTEWATPPIDAGTGGVIADGMRILLDREGLLGRALKIVQG